MTTQIMSKARGYDFDELVDQVKKTYEIPSRNKAKSLIEAAIQYGHIKPKYSLYHYIRDAIQDPDNPNKTGYETIVLWGVQGSGKSNILLQIGMWVYGGKDTSLEEAFDKANRNLVFKPLNFVAKLLSIGKWNRIPWLGWDDVGVHYSYMTFRTNVKIYEAVGKVFDAIRTKANVTGITLPVIDELPQNLKKNITFEIYVGKNQYVQIRRVFRLTTTKPAKWSNLYRIPIEPPHKIDLYKIPEYLFKKYWRRRVELANEALQDIYNTFKTTEEEKPNIDNIIEAIVIRLYNLKKEKNLNISQREIAAILGIPDRKVEYTLAKHRVKTKSESLLTNIDLNNNIIKGASENE